MAINTEVTFVDAVTVVDAAWLNLLQEHLAGLATLEIDIPIATQLRVKGGSDDDVASVYIGGFQRFRDTNAIFTFTSEPGGTYSVYVTAPTGVDSFDLDVTLTTPVVSPYRKIAEVVWNGAAIDSVAVWEGCNKSHDHSDLDGAGEVDHADVTGLTTGEPHTQYILPDGSRPFTGAVVGVAPTSAAHLATKGYVDGITVPGLPIGTILPLAGATIPDGWKLCDGASYDTTAESALFAVMAYVYGGAGADFNVPDLRGGFPLGKAAAGTGSTLGGTGGSATHTHTQPAHTHTMTAHTHTTASHTHSFPTTGNPSVNHSHTQGSTGTSGSHTHTGPSHTHTGSSLSQGTTGNEVIGAANTSQATIGLYGEDDLDQTSDSTSHSHGAGSLTGLDPISGTSSSATAGHTHLPTGNSYQHTHPNGVIGGSTAAAGTGATGSTGDHTHTNPSTSTSSNHTHGGGTSGGSAPATNSGGGGASGAAGGDVTGGSEAPHIIMNYIVRAI